MLSSPGSAFIPPAQYSPIWNLVAFAIVIGAVLIVVAIIRATRARPVEASDIAWLPPVDRDEVRARYVALIDAAESDHRSGRIGARALHQRMGSLLRQFVFEADGIEAPTMTLTDLRATRHHPLGDAVARLYPGEFAAVDRGSPAESADLARRMVRSWS